GLQSANTQKTRNIPIRLYREPEVEEAPDDPNIIPIHHHPTNAIPDAPEPSPDNTPLPAKAPVLLPINRPAPLPVEEHFENFELPPMSLLDDPAPFPHEQHDQLLRDTAALLEKTFSDFDLSVRVVGINTGPVVTQYELTLETGLRLNKVTAL